MKLVRGLSFFSGNLSRFGATFALASMIASVQAADVVISASVNGKGVVLGPGSYPSGTQVTLRAAPDVDWRFDHWEGVPTEVAQQNPVVFSPSQDTQVTAVMAAKPGAGRFVGGPVVIWGTRDITVPEGLGPAIDVAANGATAISLKKSGAAVSFGNNESGQTNVPPGLDDVVAIDAGFFHHLAVRSNGTVVAWGRNNRGQTNVPVGLTNVYTVAAGGSHSLALKRDGTVEGWGFNFYGQATPPAGLRNVVQIAAGENFSLALTADGAAVAWGSYSGGGIILHWFSRRISPASPPFLHRLTICSASSPTAQLCSGATPRALPRACRLD